MDYQIHVAGAVIIRDRKVLSGSSRGRPHLIAPGGKLEGGETAEEAITRELKEEFDIDVLARDLRPFGTFYEDAALGDFNKGKKVRMDTYLVSSWRGEPKETNEIDKVVWIDSGASNSLELGSILKNHILPKLKQEGLID